MPWPARVGMWLEGPTDVSCWTAGEVGTLAFQAPGPIREIWRGFQSPRGTLGLDIRVLKLT